MRRRVHLGLGAALLLLAACKSEPNGLHIDITKLDTYGPQITTLKVTVTASGGFMATPPQPSTPGVTLSTETDASNNQALVLTFTSPPFHFGNELSFVVETANGGDLTMTAAAVGFDSAGKTKTGANAQSATLPAGGSATIQLALEARSDQTNSQTRTTDLQGTATDATVKGAAQDGHLTSLAVCDVDGDGADDVIIGAPDVDAKA